MKNSKWILLLVLCISLLGCVSWIIPSPKVVLLPEERIFTIPAGQEINVLLDKKPMTMTFPYDMKLVSPQVLVRQEQQLNDALFKGIEAEKKNDKIITLLVGIFGVISGIIGIGLKNKLTATKK